MIRNIPLELRGPTSADFPRIASDYLHGVREGSEYSRVNQTTYYWHQHKLLESLWNDPDCAWVIAVDPAKPDYISGWLCGQRAQLAGGESVPVLHYIYVRATERRLGVGTRLLHALCGDLALTAQLPATVLTTALTPTGVALMRKDPGRYLYNPYLLWARLGK